VENSSGIAILWSFRLVSIDGIAHFDIRSLLLNETSEPMNLSTDRPLQKGSHHLIVQDGPKGFDGFVVTGRMDTIGQ
jgi:hypothetical protein